MFDATADNAGCRYPRSDTNLPYPIDPVLRSTIITTRILNPLFVHKGNQQRIFVPGSRCRRNVSFRDIISKIHRFSKRQNEIPCSYTPWSGTEIFLKLWHKCAIIFFHIFARIMTSPHSEGYIFLYIYDVIGISNNNNN